MGYKEPNYNIEMHVHWEANHPVPHAHAKLGSLEASFRISDGLQIVGNFKDKKQLKAIKDYISKHRDEMLAEWNAGEVKR